MPRAKTTRKNLHRALLRLSREAKALLFAYYKVTEQAQAPGGELEQVKSFASKSPEQAARIAGT